MRILDVTDNEITNPNYDLGYLTPETIVIAHHDAIEAVEEQWHYEYTTFPNGGREAIRVVDVPGVEAADAWDEYEDIYRYIEYTDVELAELETIRQREARMNELIARGALATPLYSGVLEEV